MTEYLDTLSWQSKWMSFCPLGCWMLFESLPQSVKGSQSWCLKIFGGGKKENSNVLPSTDLMCCGLKLKPDLAHNLIKISHWEFDINEHFRDPELLILDEIHIKMRALAKIYRGSYRGDYINKLYHALCSKCGITCCFWKWNITYDCNSYKIKDIVEAN